MQRKPWSTDPKQIAEALHALIDGQFMVTLQRQEGRPFQTRLLGIHSHGQTPYLLIARPPGLDNAYQVRELLFKLKGTPILGFSCPITREGDSILATMMPNSLFCLELRAHGRRLEPPEGSMATFFVKNRSKVNICTLQNINMGGARLTGQLPPQSVEVHDAIGPCTLSLAGKDAIINRQVTINTSEVVQLQVYDNNQISFGLKFELTDNETLQLADHIEFLYQLASD